MIDLDVIARAVAAPGSKILSQLQHEFGSMIIQGDGTLNRGLLGKVVFGHPRRLSKLNAIIQPAIRERFEGELAEAVATGADLVVADVPLLYEQKYEDYFDGVAVVTVPAKQQQERLAVRDGLTVNEALARIDAQLPLDEKVARADFASTPTFPPNCDASRFSSLLRTSSTRTSCEFWYNGDNRYRVAPFVTSTQVEYSLGV
ncbi:dephospho-CoA kinase [Lacticaseibacillus pantheris]|uniref:dephospho-CoA kinase n=1 Tax=Lacticaseibacillus pantheris TaxID=171523 RepID=UPI000B0ED197